MRSFAGVAQPLRSSCWSAARCGGAEDRPRPEATSSPSPGAGRRPSTGALAHRPAAPERCRRLAPAPAADHARAEHGLAAPSGSRSSRAARSSTTWPISSGRRGYRHAPLARSIRNGPRECDYSRQYEYRAHAARGVLPPRHGLPRHRARSACWAGRLPTVASAWRRAMPRSSSSWCIKHGYASTKVGRAQRLEGQSTGHRSQGRRRRKTASSQPRAAPHRVSAAQSAPPPIAPTRPLCLQ